MPSLPGSPMGTTAPLEIFRFGIQTRLHRVPVEIINNLCEVILVANELRNSPWTAAAWFSKLPVPRVATTGSDEDGRRDNIMVGQHQ